MDRSKARALAPGDLHTPPLPLSRFRQPIVSGAVTAYYHGVKADTTPVLVLGNHHGQIVRELVQGGHRAIVINHNPLPLLWMHCELNTVPIQALQRALTTIAHSDKAGQRLIQFIEQNYATQCPHCHATIQAEYFIWDRDAHQPIEKHINCPDCNTRGLFPIGAEDLAKLETIGRQARAARYIALQHIAPKGTPFRERADELLNLYTPRNLSVLSAILRQFPRCSDDPNIKREVACILLQALDQGSMLNAPDNNKQRPRTLRPNSTYSEYNVWLVIQSALEIYAQMPAISSLSSRDSLDALLKSQDSGYVLLARSIPWLAHHLASQKLAQIIWQLDSPDVVFTTLSALWAGWLWGDASYQNLQPLIAKRRHDIAWYENLLEQQLQGIQSILGSKGHITLIAPNTPPFILAATHRVLNHHGYALQQWSSTTANDSYLTFKQDSPSAQNNPPNFAQYTQQVNALRGFPTAVAFCARCYAIEYPDATLPSPKELSQLSRPASALLLDLDLPATSIALGEPLYDQVERKIAEYLKQQETWTRSALLNAVYEEFHGVRSPDLALVQACIDAYATTVGNAISLRPEDRPHAREADITHSKHMLYDLGTRLDYQVISAPNGDYQWTADGNTAYCFRVITDALIARHLLASPPKCEGKRCLVIPGGRAGLVAHKIALDQRLQRVINNGVWTFIKYRHLRRMAQDLSQRNEIDVYLGLDPIAEQAQAQLILPLT